MMSEREIYERISRLDFDRSNELVTILSGEHMGRKALFTDGKEVWSSIPESAGEIAKMNPGNLFRETLGHTKTLVVCGAGYVGQAVIRLGKVLGWHVVSIDDRVDFAGQAKLAGADRVICDEFAHALSGAFEEEKSLQAGAPEKAESSREDVPFSYDADTFFVVVTRGHSWDAQCLHEILKHPFGYLGMMGSRVRSARMRDRLLDEGFSRETVDKLHAPVGLKIGAQTPSEIAVSILAEIIQVRQSMPQDNVFPDDLMESILESGEGKAVLVTIVACRGSAPRKAGTRMLVKADGTTKETVGGGCMEAEIVRRARDILSEVSDGKLRQGYCENYTVDLTGRSGNASDMVCGGITQVILEII